MYASVVGARQGLADLAAKWGQMERGTGVPEPARFTALVRARRAQHPGIVFARAAAIAEVDPLTDVESRLLVGLPVL